MSEKELEIYFKSDKSDWFIEGEDEQKIWDFNKVAEFWERIRIHKTSKGDFNFQEFIFPVFEEHKNKRIKVFNPFDKEKEIVKFPEINFFKEMEGIPVFEKEVDFTSAVFLGKVYFLECTFRQPCYFSGAQFFDYSTFSNVVFDEEVCFTEALFHDGAVFSYLDFHANAKFNFIEFKDVLILVENNFDKLDFSNSSFNKKSYFTNLSSSKKVSFSSCFFDESVSFVNIFFEGDVNFFDTRFKTKTTFIESFFGGVLDFSFVSFGDEVVYKSVYFGGICYFVLNQIKNLKIIDLNKKYDEDREFMVNGKDFSHLLKEDFWKEYPELSFEDIDFASETSFIRTNLHSFKFYNCDLSDIKFSRCKWNVKKERLILKGEGDSFKDSEIHYRQLKKKFDSDKDWEYSGYAYISEMEMRKKRLWKEGKYFDWLIYRFYDLFGGYTQDYKKPLVSLLTLILVFSMFYYFIDFSLLKALQRGFKGALPYVQIDTENAFSGYWLILRNIQFLFGGTFLTFFILALRKRFKQ